MHDPLDAPCKDVYLLLLYPRDIETLYIKKSNGRPDCAFFAYKSDHSTTNDTFGHREVYTFFNRVRFTLYLRSFRFFDSAELYDGSERWKT